jgi:hypothetical protein
MCDQHCSVCDKGFTESCRLATCPAWAPVVITGAPRGVSPIEALQAAVKAADRRAFENNCFPSMAEWSAIVEMVRDLEELPSERELLALPAPVARKTEGNVVAFKPRAR